ncbi:metal ABC transporter substrate-binding protein [Synechococcus elongatus]|uniref:metal ABC transporter substrate-binding protein n=1 Tax=Synechococcus elongatus TaxID=32046 RepID=UPI0030CEFFA5
MSRLAPWLAHLGLLISISLVACQDSSTRNSSQPESLKVVVSTTILTDLTQRIGGDAITVTGLLQPGDDPHVYEPVPRDTVAFSRSQLDYPQRIQLGTKN